MCRTISVVVLAGGVVAALPGCDPGPPPADGPPVELITADYRTIDDAVRAHKGSVVVVDFWATTCGYCVERFPHLVALHTRYHEAGLVCVSVSLDMPGDRGAALRFLKKQRATFPNFLWDDPSPEAGKGITRRYGFAGGLPHLVVFGRTGERVWAHTGADVSLAVVDRLVQDELSKK